MNKTLLNAKLRFKTFVGTRDSAANQETQANFC